MLVRDGQLVLDPALEDIKAHVLQTFDDMIQCSQFVDDISVMVGQGGGGIWDGGIRGRGCRMGVEPGVCVWGGEGL